MDISKCTNLQAKTLNISRAPRISRASKILRAPKIQRASEISRAASAVQSFIQTKPLDPKVGRCCVLGDY